MNSKFANITATFLGCGLSKFVKISERYILCIHTLYCKNLSMFSNGKSGSYLGIIFIFIESGDSFFNFNILLSSKLVIFSVIIWKLYVVEGHLFAIAEYIDTIVTGTYWESVIYVISTIAFCVGQLLFVDISVFIVSISLCFGHKKN